MKNLDRIIRIISFITASACLVLYIIWYTQWEKYHGLFFSYFLIPALISFIDILINLKKYRSSILSKITIWLSSMTVAIFLYLHILPRVMMVVIWTILHILQELGIYQLYIHLILFLNPHETLIEGSESMNNINKNKLIDIISFLIGILCLIRCSLYFCKVWILIICIINIGVNLKRFSISKYAKITVILSALTFVVWTVVRFITAIRLVKYYGLL